MFAAGSNTEIYKVKNGICWKGGGHAHRAERTDNAEGQNGLKIATYIDYMRKVIYLQARTKRSAKALKA